MKTLTCPIPSNINPLQTNGFMFSITKLPEVTYFCQEVNLPSIDLPAATFENPLVHVPVPGDKVSFGEVTIQFLIDEAMANYVAIHNWMIGLGFPKRHQQYADFMSSQTNVTSELISGFSDGTLIVLNSSNNPCRTVHFVDMYPSSLQSLQLTSTTTDTTYLAGVAQFQYTYYEFV